LSQVTLLFKDRILSIHPLNQHQEFIIGHADDCTIRIDSLAVSPHHARITFTDHSYSIEKLDDDARITINNREIDEITLLSDGDHIGLGKHTMAFSFDERNENHVVRDPPPIITKPSPSCTGWVQYLNGRKMGQTIQIKQGMTNISDDNEENISLISNRSGSFYLSYLKGDVPPLVNNQDIGEKSTLLENKSKISLGKQDILFYTT
jgi:predicted component of type VI protein secretion system